MKECNEKIIWIKLLTIKNNKILVSDYNVALPKLSNKQYSISERDI